MHTKIRGLPEGHGGFAEEDGFNKGTETMIKSTETI